MVELGVISISSGANHQSNRRISGYTAHSTVAHNVGTSDCIIELGKHHRLSRECKPAFLRVIGVVEPDAYQLLWIGDGRSTRTARSAIVTASGSAQDLDVRHWDLWSTGERQLLGVCKGLVAALEELSHLHLPASPEVVSGGGVHTVRSPPPKPERSTTTFGSFSTSC